MSPAHCKDMGIITRCLPSAPQGNRISTAIHRNPLLSTGFAVSFAVKGDWKNAVCERVSEDLYTKKKEPQPTKIAALFIFTFLSSSIAVSDRVRTITEDDCKDNEGAKDAVYLRMM